MQVTVQASREPRRDVDRRGQGGHLDGPGHQAADEVHEAQVSVAVSDESSSG